jgi:hypothetical protein
MIAKHVDIVAVLALLLGILICSEIRNSLWVHFIPRVRAEQITVRIPEPPVVPIVFE